jgi:hypothetical protein
LGKKPKPVIPSEARNLSSYLAFSAERFLASLGMTPGISIFPSVFSRVVAEVEERKLPDKR